VALPAPPAPPIAPPAPPIAPPTALAPLAPPIEPVQGNPPSENNPEEVMSRRMCHKVCHYTGSTFATATSAQAGNNSTTNRMMVG
jgi:hypothetical protein